MDNRRFSLLTRLSLLTRRPGFRTGRRILLAILALSIVFGISILFNSSNRVDESKDDTLVADTKLDSFERVIQEGNALEIISFLEDRNKVSSLDLPVRFEHFQNRIQLAERLTEISQIAEHNEIANDTLLDSKLSLLRIYQTNKLDTNTEVAEIEALVLGLSDSKPPKIRKKAAIADLFVKMEKLRLGQIEEIEIKNTIARIAELDLDDHELAGQMTKVIDHHNTLGVPIESLLEEITEVYASSANPKVRAVVDEIGMAFFRRDYGLLPMSDVEKQFVAETIAERTVQAETVLGAIASKSIVTGPDINSLLTSLTILAQVAPGETLNRLLKQSAEVVGGARIVEVETSRLKSLQNIAKLVGGPFPVDSFIASGGEEHSISASKNKITFLFFMVSGDSLNPHNRLNSFSTHFAKLLNDGYMGFKVIYVADEKQKEEWDELTEWHEKYPNAEVIHVRADDNLKFFQTFSIPWSPCWMLVDSEQNLAEFNLLYPVLRSRLHFYFQ